MLSRLGLNGGPCAQMDRCSSVALAWSASGTTATGMFSRKSASSPGRNAAMRTAYTMHPM